VIPAPERLETYALDCKANEISFMIFIDVKTSADECVYLVLIIKVRMNL
jgi:hypothetical protein